MSLFYVLDKTISQRLKKIALYFRKVYKVINLHYGNLNRSVKPITEV